jgi:hypothetical protein
MGYENRRSGIPFGIRQALTTGVWSPIKLPGMSLQLAINAIVNPVSLSFDGGTTYVTIPVNQGVVRIDVRCSMFWVSGTTGGTAEIVVAHEGPGSL